MNLLAGYSGLLSLAQAAYYGIGAYVSALLLTQAGLSFSLSLLGAICFNLIISFPIIWFASSLRDLYFAIATLAWQIIVSAILYNWQAVTNGPFGIMGIPKPGFGGFVFDSLPSFASFSSLVTLSVLLFFIGLHRTPLSRCFLGVRDDQLAMMSFGKKPSYFKSWAILISSGVSAIAGGLFAVYFSYIDPSSFTLDESILIICMVLVGGLGAIRGSVAGALFYVLLPEVLRFIHIPDSIAANVRMMIYAVLLILVVMYRPYGFFGKYTFE